MRKQYLDEEGNPYANPIGEPIDPDQAVASGTRRVVNLTGLVTVQIAPGVFFSTNSPEAKVRFEWDTGSNSGSWTSS